MGSIDPAAGRTGPPAHLWMWALLAGIVAGSAAGIGGEAVHGLFRPVMVYPPNWDKISPFDKPDIIGAMIRKQNPVVEAKNAAAAYGLLGALLGAALGLVGGLARRSARSSVVAPLVGVTAGVATAAGAAAILIPLFFQNVDPESGMLLGLLIHAGIWVPIGAATGLALGVGLGGRRSMVLAMLGGLAGAALGTMVFEVASALAFPDVRLDKPMPDGRPSRVMAAFCVAVFTALAPPLGWAIEGRRLAGLRTRST